MPSDTILVAGAGIGGLAAALALRRRGFDVAVFEQAPELREVGAGLSVWPNATHVLGELGVLDRVSAHGWPMRSVAVRTDRGRTLFTIRPPSHGPPALVLHRADLHDALGAELPDEVIHLGHTVRGFTEHGEGVTLLLADGSEARGAALIGADGLKSRVRAALHGDVPPSYRGYVIWRGILETAYDRQGAGWASETLGRGRRFGLFGVGSGRSYWYACENAPEGMDDDKGDMAGYLRERFADWAAPIPAVIDAIDEATILRSEASDRPPLRRWSEGLATLLGDAAHPTTPNLGQGACLALEDALVLARCLKATPSDFAGAFARYERLRRRRTARIVRQSRWFGVVGQWENPIAVALRNALGRYTPDALSAGAIQASIGYRA